MNQKDKVKDPRKKAIVEEVQRQIRKSIDDILGREGKLRESTKSYIEALEGNIKRAPYVFGWLYWPEETQKKKRKGEN